VGAGMVGMSLAHQILERFHGLSIVIIDKEADVGKHGSGRNSGVLHAGLYYQPESLKAKVCVPGAKRLKQWCYSNDISVMECGKVITPQKPELDVN
jgi:Predicted dehydrogenase